ncbi:MAG: recombination protein RarA, partial [Cyanobium sp.]
LARMIEAGEDPRFILRRLLIAAGEDIGLADPQAMVVVEACASAFERIGLPEGLYPLAQATLYLAATEKSNSSLGFFDAVKAVRQSDRQQVPAHLRDANRDGKAFGDGLGYRYPHAYSQHWVAQQYLPSALQGEVFWQPGGLGWEGHLRPRLLQRRAAQLAAAAESACDPPELLSSGPEDPVLTRWLQRQAAGEGERLDRLRQRFWQGATIGRLDRVLVLEARSLLWALDPLEATAEGEVVIALKDEDERERLQAQVQLLEPLRRPRLLLVDPRQPRDLDRQLEQEHRFEWVAARQPFRELSPRQRGAAIDAIGRWSTPEARLRLLFSDPLLGPLGSLLAAAADNTDERERGDGDTVVAQALAIEQPELQERLHCAEAVVERLRRGGWRVEIEAWEESLSLTLGDALLDRWFRPAVDYRNRLERRLGSTATEAIEALFRRHQGKVLPQPLRHTLIRAHRDDGRAGPGETRRRRTSTREGTAGPEAQARPLNEA